jgi:hypothetical protein
MTEPSPHRKRPPGRRLRTKISALSAAIGIALLAGCGGAAAPAGPPKAAALAARLGCHVTSAVTGGVAAYDTVQYVNAAGGPCSNATIGGQGIIIMTFASQAKETDWLHQNANGMQASLITGYAEVVSGHLWAIASGGYGVFPTSYVIRKLGGKDTTF